MWWKRSKFLITGSNSQKNKVINLDIKKFKNVIGISISNQEVNKILTSLGCKIKISKKTIKVEVPSWRPISLKI